MTSEASPGDVTPVSADQWQALGVLESDIVLVIDPAGSCSWALGAPWEGRTLLDLFSVDDHPAIQRLLGPAPAGPLWVRETDPEGEVTWLHAVSVPRSDGGWVVQIRRPRQVRSVSHSEANGLDHVTGVVGRDRALDEVAFLLSATPRTGKETAIACCSLDDLAAVTGAHGEAAADEVLRVVAARVSETLRSGDLVARIGHDELLIVLRGIHHLRGALRVANKIRSVVEDPIPVGDAEIVQTVCVGVTVISRGEGVDSVLKRARGALAMAQETGHNMVMSSPPL